MDEINIELEKIDNIIKELCEYKVGHEARVNELFREQKEFNKDIKMRLEVVVMKTNAIGTQVLVMTAIGVMIGGIITLVATPIFARIFGA